MKKLMLVVPLLLLALLLSGCGLLDDMRAQHALEYDDGTIKYNNKIYKRIDEESLQTEKLQEFSIDFGKNLYITEPDVPVLLSQMGIHKWLPYVSSDGSIICSYTAYYVREDRYEDIIAQFTNGIEYTKYLYYLSEEVYLTPDQTATLQQLLKESTPVKTADSYYPKDSLAIYMESADGLFEKYAFELIGDDNGYGILDYNTGMLYPATEEYNALLQSLLSTVQKEEIYDILEDKQ